MKKILLEGEIPVNCYFIEDQGKCYIIDPGYEKNKVINYIEDHQLEVLGILVTHGHIDHIGALDAYQVPVYIHEDELDILNNNYLNGFVSFNKAIPYDIHKLDIIKVKNGDVMTLNNQKIEVIHTPGHTKGSVCFKVNKDLYTGDTLFKGSVGRWDFPTGNQGILANTVTKLIDQLSDDICIHPAHGESSTILKEKKR